MKKCILTIILSVIVLSAYGQRRKWVTPSAPLETDRLEYMPSGAGAMSSWIMNRAHPAFGIQGIFSRIPRIRYKDPYYQRKRIKNIHAVEMSKDDDTGLITARWSDGTMYRGQMYYGKMRGVGTMIYPDGSKYSGEWRGDRPNGSGTFVTPEGVVCEVDWVDGIPHGRGIIQDIDGKHYSAKWYDGVLRPRSIRPVEGADR